jgi:hypothetical protein
MEDSFEGTLSWDKDAATVLERFMDAPFVTASPFRLTVPFEVVD